MIAINDLSFHFGGRTLYDGASLHIKPKDRIGLIGPNGAGKSTLLRLITGEYSPDGGSISMSNDCSIGFLNQDLLSYQTEDSILLVAMQAFERGLEVQRQIDNVLHQMEKHYEDHLVDKLTRLQEEFELLDGYTMQARAEAILEGLGFSTDELQRPLREFSGGWRMRVMLAKLLLQKPSLLMLDEPTNHLDLPSIQWVENYLTTYEGAVIVVSHDRQFLDNVSNMIVEVAQQQLNVYPGNYSFFLEEKSLRNEIQKNAYENQQAKIRQTERFIERFRSKATKARQVQSRVKALERMETIDDVVDQNARVHFRFNFSQPSGRQVIELKDVSKAYGNKVILQHTHAMVQRGDKIALVGANGRGKSTLLRILSGGEQVQGERNEGYNVIQAFYAQHQLESLNVENNLLDELKQAGSGKTEMELRTVLGCFLFSDDEVFKKIKVLSGGEKSRVALARTLISEANFLLLDEPTNHLDMQSVNILIQALQQYEGSFVCVSHDRHFVSHIANKIWYIEEHEIKEYPGTFDEYLYWQQQREAQRASAPPAPAPAPQPQKTASPADTQEHQEARRTLKQLRGRLEVQEKEIEELERQKATLEEEMADPTIYANPDQLHTVNGRYQRLQQSIDTQNTAWEKLMLEIEALEKKIGS
ncbi:ATP-binding cassette, subfamily F, member 3 [Catalinimonas alkaloidigena]|uniref:ATP-binding cassette, subfamily F, member 3 n=1 Tax=Catalinimonas alkaloidigena TaxID=1075417 RepID=A0A1G8WDG3_9BACT|nr:ABC-F family ATP-binding cassette domain-containing protein [Catalinimonas alkaloidigena]SDJ76328.1 ATP-binding cassette, subfamily F, member 3 [Catalinimonas alkaloidigena]